MNIKNIISFGTKKLLQNKEIFDAISESRLILAFVLKTNLDFIILNEDFLCSKKVLFSYKRYLKKRINNLPFHYITKRKNFYNFNFFISKNCLIPRNDSEIIVESVINFIDKNFDENKKINIIDICSGSGCLGLSVLQNCKNKNINLTLFDISKKAIYIAKKNTREMNLKAKFINANLFNYKFKNTFDIVISNPPYLTKNEMNNLTLDVQCEPEIALFGGEDGLDFYSYLAKIHIGKYYFLELNSNLTSEILSIFQKENYTQCEVKYDYNPLPRMLFCKS